MIVNNNLPIFILLDDGSIVNVNDICYVNKSDGDILLTMKHTDYDLHITEHDYQTLVKKLINF